ncbi:DsbE family thiol:disulfide interchange protein [Hyphococcus sp.]|jgi:cytochrome c biogenesis protein CcmG/thiol:disulfide interchange protein DsbE|uniref:DsbE family thiol:disulfide interchange protein n=1 Tax=Hyphococcus sp. TaxID=2038636 RepID=UPI003D122BDA
MNRLLLLLPVLLFLVVGAFFAWGLTRDPSAIPSQLIDKPLPQFDLPAIEGMDEGFSSEELKGEVTLLNVFASWCVSCHIEHPFLMQLAEDDVIKIYGLNWKEKPGEGKAWLDRLGNPYTRVGDDQAGRVAIDLGVTGAPETFVIDKQGRVRYRVAMPITEPYWNETLAPMIEELRRQ